MCYSKIFEKQQQITWAILAFPDFLESWKTALSFSDNCIRLFKLSKQDQNGPSETTAGGDEGKNKKDINSLVGAIMFYYINSTT